MVFFFNDTATTEIYTLSLHDALPISADTSYSAIAKPNSDATATPSETQGYHPPAEPPEPAKASNASSFSFPESRIEDVTDYDVTAPTVADEMTIPNGFSSTEVETPHEVETPLWMVDNKPQAPLEETPAKPSSRSNSKS